MKKIAALLSILAKVIFQFWGSFKKRFSSEKLIELPVQIEEQTAIETVENKNNQLTVMRFKKEAKKALLSCSKAEALSFSSTLLCLARSLKWEIGSDEIIKYMSQVYWALYKCPVEDRHKLVRRMFRRSNPQFSLPVAQVKVKVKVKVVPPKRIRMREPERNNKVSHRTSDVGQRAADIADRASEEVWRQTRSFEDSSRTWLGVYGDSLRGFSFEQ